jgi:electron transport complex protein RnfE
MSTPESGGELAHFQAGVWSENPVLVQLLGMCPTLAVTNSLENALVMGAAASFVVVCSNLVTSLLRSWIRPHLRILVFTLTIATFVTLADRVLQAYMWDVSRKLGAFVPLIIVNCIIIARAEVCALRSRPLRAGADGLGVGLGFTLALALLGAVREVLGSGTLLGVPVLGAGFEPWVVMALPAGAFLTLGAVIGVVNHLRGHAPKGALG